MGDFKRRPRVLFVGTAYAGHRTRFLNLQAHVEEDGRLDPTFRWITGWRQGGVIERLPAVPRAVRGRARALVESAAFATFPRPDVVWTSAPSLLLPWMWTQIGPLHRPMLLDVDSTRQQLEDMAPFYRGRPPHPTRPHARLGDRLLYRDRDIMLMAWSNWAAEGLRRAGASPQRVVVQHPGVDLDLWRMPQRCAGHAEGPLRMLFVGGDFVRKGGETLLDLMRGPLLGRCELDIVTNEQVEPPAGVGVHRAEPNSEKLRQLFARADLFVLPTRAECFGIAAVEAMASGLPVVMGDVGGARDIVTHGETDWLVKPEHAEVLAAIECALQQRGRLPSMGERARQVAERRFDGQRNDRAIVDLALELHGRSETRNQRSFNGDVRQPHP